MGATVDIHGPGKRVLLLASNPATSSQTGWPVGFWWAELTHPYWEFVQGRFRPHAVPDGNLVTGQQQYSGADAARLVTEALGR